MIRRYPDRSGVRKAIVMLTDGVDNGSRKASLKQNLRDAEEANVVIYTVQYNTLPQLPQRLKHIADDKTREQVRLKLTKNYAVGSTYLQFLAEKTGGRMYRADDLAEVPNMFNAITETSPSAEKIRMIAPKPWNTLSPESCSAVIVSNDSPAHAASAAPMHMIHAAPRPEPPYVQ